ncbi:MAG: DUF167 domain-containing protein [Methanomassiliicoccales archaeon]|nr:DUF167 domain-containing protein [Methanomassiliicoccales archaeon]
MDLSKCLRPSGTGAELDIIVTPNCSAPGVQDVDPWRHRLVVKVRAPPEGGKANEEVEELLSDTLDAKVSVVRGHLQRMKVVHVQASSEKVRSALEDR